MTFMPMIFRLSKHILHLFVVLNVQGLTDNSIEMSLAIERPTETISYLKLFVHRIRRHSESRFEGLLISKYIEEKPFPLYPLDNSTQCYLSTERFSTRISVQPLEKFLDPLYRTQTKMTVFPNVRLQKNRFIAITFLQSLRFIFLALSCQSDLDRPVYFNFSFTLG